MKKILFVAKTNEFGGAERHLLELIRRLARYKTQLSILCLDTDFYTRYLNNSHAEVIIPRVPLRSFQDWFRAFRQIKPDVVVFIRGVLWTFEWYIPMAACLAGVRRRISIAHLPPPPPPVQLEGWSIRSVLSRLRRMRRLASRRVSAFFESSTICVSNAIRDSLMRDYRFPEGSTITIHNGVSLSEFAQSEDKGLNLRTRLHLSPDEFLLVCVARLSEQKQLDALLLAVGRVLRSGVNCKCVIVGDGPLRASLEQQSLALGLSGSVFFEGFREDVRPYLQAGSAFVLTSRREGLPLAILEAMACGLPCIVTKVGGNCEVVTHGVNGLVVNAGSVDEIASAISYLATHSQDREEMSRMARSRVREDFNLDDRMGEVEEVILN